MSDLKPLNPAPMTLNAKLALGGYIGALNAVLTIVIIVVWPGSGACRLPLESRYLLTCAAAGALGSYIHLATSFIEHAGKGNLQAAWAWWYFFRPWIGSALALVVYFVLRAGLIAGPADAGSAANPYGVAAISALSGMFSHQATEKLREVFENICTVDRSTTR